MSRKAKFCEGKTVPDDVGGQFYTNEQKASVAHNQENCEHFFPIESCCHGHQGTQLSQNLQSKTLPLREGTERY